MSDTQNTVAAVKKELLTRLGHDADIFVLISLCTREPYVVCDCLLYTSPSPRD